MKGMVFTEFLEMVETTFSADMVDDILEDADPASGGAYTAVGIYDHQELVDMVLALAKRTGNAPTELVQAFGRHLFSVFYQRYPTFFDGVEDAFSFLAQVEDFIHPEVLKLYPDAQLPRFDCQRDGDQLEMIYHSSRHFADLAEGLIAGCAQHFKEQILIQREELSADSTRFLLTRPSTP
ncbi:heme NO-binding domain-containing protein [Nitrincola tapanii]|uniref:Heme NO-binding domain-containing protein n=1 Tax=Nitrincola tapanii TaxID=1708751 RepID=A0A5A9W4F5_9GAMM|nr:heme NO-binding domain-containing protein [Nitrincola tapanii]KAA0874421.1 hypothetical protein E1H14_09110 [Nitrincola tapanii]